MSKYFYLKLMPSPGEKKQSCLSPGLLPRKTALFKHNGGSGNYLNSLTIRIAQLTSLAPGAISGEHQIIKASPRSLAWLLEKVLQPIMTQFLNRLPSNCGLPILCGYHNPTPQVQIIRITNIPNWGSLNSKIQI